MRKTITTVTKGFYLLLTEMIAVYLIAFPVHAFQVSSSSTGYVRVATQSAHLAYVAAQSCGVDLVPWPRRISCRRPASVAVRLGHGAGRVGRCLGCRRPSRLAQMYYSAARSAGDQNGGALAHPLGERPRPTRSMGHVLCRCRRIRFLRGSPRSMHIRLLHRERAARCTGMAWRESAAYPGWTPIRALRDWYCGPTGQPT